MQIMVASTFGINCQAYRPETIGAKILGNNRRAANGLDLASFTTKLKGVRNT